MLAEVEPKITDAAVISDLNNTQVESLTNTLGSKSLRRDLVPAN